MQSPCKKCRGDGRVRVDREITLHVPAGVATGQYMIAPRRRERRYTRGGERGDVHVIFEVAEDQRFERHGEDLYTELLVTYPQLALGDDLSVPTVSSTMMLHVPPSTQSGQVFHLRGRGLPRVNGSGTGDLHVRVQLWTPERVSDEERALLKRLGELQATIPDERRDKGFWAKMKEALGA